MSFTRRQLPAVVLGCLCLACGHAEAGFLTDNVHGVYTYPFQGSPTIIDGGDKAVSPTASFFFATGSPNTSVAVGDATIGASFSGTGVFTTGGFNGFTITDDTRNPSIVGVVFTSNIAGFTASDLSFTANSVTANLQGLNVTASSTLSIDVQFGSPLSVPEPSSLALCGVAGVVGLAAARLRRRRGVA